MPCAHCSKFWSRTQHRHDWALKEARRKQGISSFCQLVARVFATRDLEWYCSNESPATLLKDGTRNNGTQWRTGFRCTHSGKEPSCSKWRKRKEVNLLKGTFVSYSLVFQLSKQFYRSVVKFGWELKIIFEMNSQIYTAL